MSRSKWKGPYFNYQEINNINKQKNIIKVKILKLYLNLLDKPFKFITEKPMWIF